MLAGRRSIKLDGAEVERTPLLVPSFSSKLPDWNVDDIVDAMAPTITGPILVSAYDLHYRKITHALDFASLIFVDSGGYEAIIDARAAARGEKETLKEQPWTRALHEETLAKWPAGAVFISYDHPDEVLTTRAQIERARALAPGRKGFVREFLVKPEPRNPELRAPPTINIDALVENVHSLSEFDVIGLADEDLGASLFERAKNVARLRTALTSIGLELPIHVFGSLDPFITNIYFVAGADIFDGLSWLKCAFADGETYVVKHRVARGSLDVHPKKGHMEVCQRNYHELENLQGRMRRFLRDGDFECLHHAEALRSAYERVAEQVGHDDGR